MMDIRNTGYPVASSVRIYCVPITYLNCTVHKKLQVFFCSAPCCLKDFDVYDIAALPKIASSLKTQGL
jgi:hypothetical protein